MRKLTLVTVLSLFASTGCFLRAGVMPATFAHVAPVGAPVVASGAVATSSVSSSVTVNGQPATASVTVNGQPATASVAVHSNGTMGVAVQGPNASASVSASADAP